MYTIEGSKVYLAILKGLKLIFDQYGHLHSDNAALLRFVLDHKQIFERHWRKILIDIRDGTLNRHVRVSSFERKCYEASSVPMSNLAADLEQSFRDLGFYARSTATDIVHKGYATLKHPVAGEGMRVCTLVLF